MEYRRGGRRQRGDRSLCDRMSRRLRPSNQRMSKALSLLIGAAAGYLGVRLGDLGELAVGVFLTALLVAYLRTDRITSAAALAFGAGAVILVFLGAVVLDSVRDPAVHVETLTYIGVLVGLALAAFGVALAVTATVRRG